MIDFQEELKKYFPSPEVADVQETVYKQDLVDAADIFIRMAENGKIDD